MGEQKSGSSPSSKVLRPDFRTKPKIQRARSPREALMEKVRERTGEQLPGELVRLDERQKRNKYGSIDMDPQDNAKKSSGPGAEINQGQYVKAKFDESIPYEEFYENFWSIAAIDYETELELLPQSESKKLKAMLEYFSRLLYDIGAENAYGTRVIRASRMKTVSDRKLRADSLVYAFMSRIYYPFSMQTGATLDPLFMEMISQAYDSASGQKDLKKEEHDTYILLSRYMHNFIVKLSDMAYTLGIFAVEGVDEPYDDYDDVD